MARPMTPARRAALKKAQAASAAKRRGKGKRRVPATKGMRRRVNKSASGKRAMAGARAGSSVRKAAQSRSKYRSAKKEARREFRATRKASYARNLKKKDKNGKSYHKSQLKAMAVGAVTPYGVGGLAYGIRNSKKYRKQIETHKSNVARAKAKKKSAIASAKARRKRR